MTAFFALAVYRESVLSDVDVKILGFHSGYSRSDDDILLCLEYINGKLALKRREPWLCGNRMGCRFGHPIWQSWHHIKRILRTYSYSGPIVNPTTPIQSSS